MSVKAPVKNGKFRNGASAKLKFQSWATTDAEEREKRRERARAEPMKVESTRAYVEDCRVMWR